MRSFAISTVLAVLLTASLAPMALAQVNGTIDVNQNQPAGASAGGQVLLFAPEPVQQGSSISHWDSVASPNLLMEPAINPGLAFLDLDLTTPAMEDMGWPLVAQGQTSPTQIRIFTTTPPGQGFDDPRPFAGAPGNNATTLGEARLNLILAVLGAWANTLATTVPIDVIVDWQPLFCAGGGATLAAAGTTFIFRDDGTDFPFADTWFHASLAEALSGTELTGAPNEPNGAGDIVVFMNSEIDNECLGEGTGYYYGTDGTPAPANLVDAAPTVLHELGHGLGFANFTNEAVGEFIQGFPGIYDQFTLDTTTNQTFAQMTPAERVAAATKSRRIAWNGPNVTQAAATFLDGGTPRLTINSPLNLAGGYPIGTASFGSPVTASGVTGDIACMFDETVPGEDSPFDGCSAATNPDEIDGNIALVARGGCSFVTKAANAQAAGAIGLIVSNTRGGVFGLGGSDPDISIPAVGLGRRDGNTIRQAACPNTAGFLFNDRFELIVEYDDGASRSGVGTTSELTPQADWTWFFNPDNPETLVKILDGCGINGHFWVFAGGLTNVEVTLTITDTSNGAVKTYRNSLGTPFEPIQDTQAFATCP